MKIDGMGNMYVAQWFGGKKEGKHAIKWTRLSCTTFRANAVRLQLRALAYNLANLLRTLALPGGVERWSQVLRGTLPRQVRQLMS